MSCGLWRPVEPLHDTYNLENFIVPDPPINFIPPNCSNKSQSKRKIGQIVESIILSNDRFYQILLQRNPRRREFTLNGVRIFHPCSSENSRKRVKSFLWNDWKNNDCHEVGSDSFSEIASLNNKLQTLSESIKYPEYSPRHFKKRNSLPADIKEVCENFILAEKYSYFTPDWNTLSQCSSHTTTHTTFSSLKTLDNGNALMNSSQSSIRNSINSQTSFNDPSKKHVNGTFNQEVCT